jgi:cytoskeletal protein RodZ
MVAVALILLVLVAVLTVGIAVSNPDIYDLSIFGAVVKVSSIGIFLTGAITMALTVVALLLLRIGIRRGRARRKEIKELQAASDNVPASSEEDSTASKTSDTSTASDSAANEPATAEPASTTKEKPSPDVEGETSTTAAERKAMLDKADAITRDEQRT